MTTRQATTYTDYQQRAREFKVGDMAFPVAPGVGDALAGRVVAVYPAIGCVDLEFAWGSGRYPVEELQRVTDISTKPPAPDAATVPGDAGTVRVPGVSRKAVQRVSRAFVKQALYWAARNRHYKATRPELDAGKYACPKCKDESSYLRPASYEMSEGQRVHVLGCPQCLFLIKRCDIIGDPDFEEHGEPEAPLGREMVVRFHPRCHDGAQSLANMLAYIQQVASWGHSFSIVVDPDDSELTKSFGFDGDGSDKIESVTLDGQPVGED